jgi:hypothetical protein
MIDRGHDLPVAQQAKALGISRSSVYYLPHPIPVADLAVMRRMVVTDFVEKLAIGSKQQCGRAHPEQFLL